ncbi:MAG: hypothetical protein Q9195_006021 [Heterodermia aff. obscurata]
MADTTMMDHESLKKYIDTITMTYVDPNIDKQAIIRPRDLRSNWERWPIPVDTKITVAHLSKKHEVFKSEWEASDAYGTMSKLFEETVLQQNRLTIRACMFLGLGKKHNMENIYFQEPEFNTVDEEFLRARGHTVLHTPESDDYTNENTLLYSHAGFIAEWSTISVAIPAVFISSKIHDTHIYHDFPHNFHSQASADRQELE